MWVGKREKFHTPCHGAGQDGVLANMPYMGGIRDEVWEATPFIAIAMLHNMTPYMGIHVQRIKGVNVCSKTSQQVCSIWLGKRFSYHFPCNDIQSTT